MNDDPKLNEFALAGWLAIAAAVLTLPMFGLGLFVDIIGKRAPEVAPTILIPYIAVALAHTVFSLYAFLRFRTLLNRRHDFHDVDSLVTAIVAGVILISLVGIPARVLATFDLVPLAAILVFLGFMVIAAVTLGVLSIIFAVRLLRLESDLNGMLKPYAYITIAAAICFTLFITAPLGMIIDAVGNVILGRIFLKPEAEVLPDFV